MNLWHETPPNKNDIHSMKKRVIDEMFRNIKNNTSQETVHSEDEMLDM